MFEDGKPVVLNFKHLYDNVWAAFLKREHSWQRSGIIMPHDFQPKTGKTYECHVQSTISGTFNYNSQDYDLYFATLADAGTIIDVIEHKFEQPKSLGTLADALKGIKLADLPKEHEMITLETQADKKNSGLMFRPQYLNSDPHAAGKPSMRFFIAVNNGFQLQLGKTYPARVKKINVTDKTTKTEAIIVQVMVEVI
jgi:hypothetical protein